MPEPPGLAIEETLHDHAQKCPYCRYQSHTLYRLESWADEEAGCAGCVLSLLMDGEYTIHAQHDQSAS
jgi:hypothetical protein